VWEFTIEPALWMGVAKNQQEIARRAADQIDNFIDQEIEGLTKAVQISSLWDADKERRKETLYRILKLDPRIEEISMADETGREVIRFSRLQVYTESDMRLIGKEEKFRRAFEGQVYTSSVYHASTAEPFITLAVPIKPAASEIKGVIVAEVSLKRLWSSIADIEAGKSAQIFVVDHKGKLIAHPDYSKVLSGTDLSALPEVKEFLDASEHDPDFGTPVTGQDGKQVMSTFARVEHPNWAVIVEESVATSLQEVNQIADFAILIFVLTLGGTFGISYYFSGRVTRQVRQLEDQHPHQQERVVPLARLVLGDRLPDAIGIEEPAVEKALGEDRALQERLQLPRPELARLPPHGTHELRDAFPIAAPAEGRRPGGPS